MSERRKDPREKKCGICGKDLYAGEDWAYKRRPGRGDKTTWFCSYKCMRAYDAKHGQKKRPEGLPVDLNATAPKEPVSRAVLAKALAEEIKRGGSVIAYMKAEGYKNPWEAYNAVRHYCETNMPELAEVLKPLKELPKGPQQKTGRPKKAPAEVEKVDKVPPVEPDPEPVQCIAHVTDAELAEAEEPEKPAVDPTIDFEEIRKMDRFLHIYSKDDMLRIVDEAALKVQADKAYRWGSDSLEQQMFHDARSNAVGVGVMKLRKEIRRMLKAEEDDDE